MKIITLKDVKDCLKDIPEELLDNIHFGLGEGAEEQVSMLAPEGSDKYDFPEVWEIVDKEYPQLNDLNHFIKNIARVQSIIDEDGENAEKISDKYFEEEISSEDFPEDRPKSSELTKIIVEEQK
jgi:hypothetical protein